MKIELPQNTLGVLYDVRAMLHTYHINSIEPSHSRSYCLGSEHAETFSRLEKLMAQLESECASQIEAEKK